MNVSVDWNWVKRHLPFLLANQQAIYSYTGLSIFGSSAATTTISASTIQSLLSTQVISFINGVFNTTILTVNSTTIDIFNQTLVINNVTIPIALLAAALPNGLQNYTLSIASDYTIMHNSTCIHGVSYFGTELMAAAMLKCRYSNDDVATTNGNGYDGFYLNKNHPLPLTARQTLENKLILSLLASIFILIPLCYIPASFVSFIVKERETKAKHLQFISSISPNLYWLATYLWDLGLFLVLIVFIMISFYIYGEEAAVIFISNTESASAIFVLLLTYGMSVLPLCYLYSNMFTSHSTAIISVTAINFFTGFVAVLGYNIMRNIGILRNSNLYTTSPLSPNPLLSSLRKKN